MGSSLGGRPYDQDFYIQDRKRERTRSAQSRDDVALGAASLVYRQDMDDSIEFEEQSDDQRQIFASHCLPQQAQALLVDAHSNVEPSNNTIDSPEHEDKYEHLGDAQEMIGDGGPPFKPIQQKIRICTEDGSEVIPSIFASVEKAFFFVNGTWICYRRNYFRATGGYALSYLSEDKRFYLNSSDGESMLPVSTINLAISAKVLDAGGKPVGLVQHTAKRDKGPVDSPLHLVVECSGDGHVGEAVYGWDRLQFKSATANNGKRKAAQQYFGISIELRMKTSDGFSYLVATRTTVGCVVRGRSPGHYNDRLPPPGEPYAIPNRDSLHSSTHGHCRMRSSPTPIKQEAGGTQDDLTTLRQEFAPPTLQQPSPQSSLQMNYSGTPYLGLNIPSPGQAYGSNLTPVMFYDRPSPTTLEMSSSPFGNLMQSHSMSAQSNMTTPPSNEFTTPRLTASPHWYFPEPNSPAVANSSAKPLPMISECLPPDFDSNSTQLPSHISGAGEVEQRKGSEKEKSPVPIPPFHSHDTLANELGNMKLPTFPPLTPAEEKELLRPVSGYAYYPSTLISPSGTPAVPLGGIIFDPHAQHTNRPPDADDHNCLHASGIAWGGFEVQPYVPRSVGRLNGGAIGSDSPLRRPSTSSTLLLDKSLKRESAKREKEENAIIPSLDKLDFGKIVAKLGRFEAKDSSAGYYPDLQPV